jgi:hypothetical protein
VDIERNLFLLEKELVDTFPEILTALSVDNDEEFDDIIQASILIGE